MNSFARITLASVMIFVLITVKFISMILCIPIALICGNLFKIYQKLGGKKFFNEESFHRTALKMDKEETTYDFFGAAKNWLFFDDCFKHVVPECLRNCIVLPVLSNISPQMRECVLTRRSTFDKVRQDEIRGNEPHVSALAADGFFYEEASSSVQCCRCTSLFELKKMPEKREEWHTQWCHFYEPAQVETTTRSPDLDAPRSTSITQMQETLNISEDNDTRQPGQINSSSQATGLHQAHVDSSSQLLQHPRLRRQVQSSRPVPTVQPNNLGPPVQPTSRGQPQRPAGMSTNPQKVYKTFEARETSIAGKEWAVEPNTPHALAMNGLYYGGVGDRLCCFSCKFLITGWYESGTQVDVKKEHAKYSPLCGSVRHRPSPE